MNDAIPPEGGPLPEGAMLPLFIAMAVVWGISYRLHRHLPAESAEWWSGLLVCIRNASGISVCAVLTIALLDGLDKALGLEDGLSVGVIIVGLVFLVWVRLPPDEP